VVFFGLGFFGFFGFVVCCGVSKFYFLIWLLCKGFGGIGELFDGCVGCVVVDDFVDLLWMVCGWYGRCGIGGVELCLILFVSIVDDV